MAGVDHWMEKFLIVTLLATAAFTVYAFKPGIRCWYPNHFTKNHEEYSQALCATSYSTHYAIEDRLGDNGQIVSLKNATTPSYIPMRLDDNPILRLLLGEVAFALLVYSIKTVYINSSNIDAFSPLGSHKTYLKVPGYIALQLLFAAVWFTLAVKTAFLEMDEDIFTPKQFTCEFVLMRLGNLHSYSASCLTKGIDGITTAVTINLALCVVAGLAGVVNLVVILLVQPYKKLYSVATRLVEAEIIGGTSELGYSFVFSDLYFVIVFHGDRVLLKLTDNVKTE